MQPQTVPEIVFRPLAETDMSTLIEWFGQPRIARWWNPSTDLNEVLAKYLPRINGYEPTAMWIVEIGEQLAGLLQCYRHADYPQHDAAVGVADAAGIDFLLAASHQGRGFASSVLRDFASLVFELYSDVACCVATPAQANEASWRSLDRAGFTRAGECQPPDEPPAYTYRFDRPTKSVPIRS